MADCTNIGVNGSPGISIEIPGGGNVSMMGYTQVSGNMVATLKDSSGAVVAQISGNSVNPTSMGLSSFVPKGGEYTFYLNGQVLSAYDTIIPGTTAYAKSWTFVSEVAPTGGDCDFNDATVVIVWNLHKG